MNQRSPFRERGLHGDFQDTRHLFGLGDQFAEVAALRKQMFGMRLLKISTANFVAGNLGGDGEDRDAAAVAIVETIDQVEVAGAATAGADR